MDIVMESRGRDCEILKEKGVNYDKASLGMGSGWVPVSLLPVPYLCFEIGKNSNTYPNPVKTEKTRQIKFGSDRYLRLKLRTSIS
ncbi:hypothetical protein MTR_8g066785 [Medicago truncatula]|uniref:Uncharacterized protein n=1 Tax=Medicago truncatula TaxID=3880 RepID=A0A072TRB9_MEDTR|nr:hypothetical protein MTR_8g066785 [Medicago truncatula]